MPGVMLACQGRFFLLTCVAYAMAHSQESPELKSNYVARHSFVEQGAPAAEQSMSNMAPAKAVMRKQPKEAARQTTPVDQEKAGMSLVEFEDLAMDLAIPEVAYDHIDMGTSFMAGTSVSLNTADLADLADGHKRYMVNHNTGAVELHIHNVEKLAAAASKQPLMTSLLDDAAGCTGPFTVNNGLEPPELHRKAATFAKPYCSKQAFNGTELFRETMPVLPSDPDIEFVKLATERTSYDECSIPVLALLVYKPDFLLRFLQKIDFPIQELLVHQDGNDANVSRILDDYVKTVRQSDKSDSMIKTIRHVMNSNRRAGFAMAVNNFIRLYPGERFWIWMEDDVFFPPGVLGRFYQRMRNVSEEKYVAAVSASPQFLMKAWSFTRQGVLRAGLMDENFFPGFFEDDDYVLRLRLSCMSMFGIAELSVLIDDAGKADATRKNADEIQRADPEHYFHFKWGSKRGSFKYTSTLEDLKRDCVKEKQLFCSPYGLENYSLATWIPFKSHRRCAETGIGAIGTPPTCNQFLTLAKEE